MTRLLLGLAALILLSACGVQGDLSRQLVAAAADEQPG